MVAIRTLVADDEPAIREALAATISATPGFEMLATCGDGDDALRQIETLRPDVAFLDIKMPHRSGLDVINALAPAARPLVVFVTAFDEHAVAAFDVRAVDFLVKPYARARLRETLERLRERFAAREHALDPELECGPDPDLKSDGPGKPSGVPEPIPLPGIVAITRGQRIVVPYTSIRWIEAAGTYARLHIVDGPSVLVRISLNQLMDLLPTDAFLRVHRSSIVAVRCIHSSKPAGSGDSRVVLDDETVISASRTYGAALRAVLRRGGK